LGYPAGKNSDGKEAQADGNALLSRSVVVTQVASTTSAVAVARTGQSGRPVGQLGQEMAETVYGSATSTPKEIGDIVSLFMSSRISQSSK
jgi:hypothetical protein